MVLTRILVLLLTLILSLSTLLFAADRADDFILQPVEPLIGSWAFSGMVNDESGERYGYFFQMHRQGVQFQVKTALIDGQTNQLKFFYEGSEVVSKSSLLNWHVGRSFMRYNPINDSWIFGVKLENGQGFNFKVDMMKETTKDNETLILRPGVELQALQTSRLNGHIKTDTDGKEQFVTGNNAWFGKLWFSKKQDSSHDVSTTFCRLSNDNGFYSANLKEADATGAAIAGWRDSAGKKVKMSQFISIKKQANNQCLLDVALPKLKLNVINSLKQDDKTPNSVAGFSKDNKGFCFVIEQTFAELKDLPLPAPVAVG
ncbi:hypothetical protein [Legionella sp. km772]|uniref:hypothetical protein n=1 Tax=Legionella sp. km772 TaxID=2498111 RepID=UPI000F8D3521|nr:hypothetical protein [Legionella sp. km772]RUR10688.1 hypothetical protein ELY15_07810 [Legionella sp. km772]